MQEHREQTVIPGSDLLRRVVSESRGVVLLLAVVTGALGGVIASTMSALAMFLHRIFFKVPDGERLSGLHSPSSSSTFIWLIAGGLVLGLSTVVWRQFGRSEVQDPIEANALFGGRMELGGSAFVAAQAVAANGAGASVGIEGGFTQLASALGSALGQLINRPRNDLRLLVACGAAGAVAGAFDAPFAGAAYAFELILASYSSSMLAPVILAAVVGKYAASITAGHGYRIALETDLSSVGHSSLWAIGIGLASGLLAIALMYSVTRLELVFSSSRMPRPLITAVGGALVAAVALGSPHVMGSGHGAIDYLFAAPLPATALAILLALKMLACVISIGTGFRGGLFSASLLMGAALGGAAGSFVIASGLMPSSALPGMQVVAMSAFGAAVVGTPLAMAILAAEVSGQVGLMPDVLLAVISASLTVRTLFGYSFSIWRLHVRGSPARSAADIAWSRSIPIREMVRPDIASLPVSITSGELLQRHPPGSIKWIALTGLSGRYEGLCDVAEVAFSAKSHDTPALEFARYQGDVLAASESLEDALKWFEAHSREAIVVVNSRSSMQVVGILTESYVLKRYAQELERRRLS